MKPYIYFTLAAAFLQTITATPINAKPTNSIVYVIPIKGEIERGLVYVVRRGISEAIAHKASAIILDMNTPGGQVGAAEEIIDLVSNTKIRTYTYVSPNAISAGAIISMGTDEIYMAPGSKLGAAAPWIPSATGEPSQVPAAFEEKMVSYVAALVRTTAQRKKHDPQLAEAMVRVGPEYRIEDEVICASNRLLTLTNLEAERLVGKEGAKRKLLSQGTIENFDELLKTIGHPSSQVIRLNITPEEKIARYIESFSKILLIGGLLLLYIEFKTPGVILPGIAGVVLLAIWFWGYHIAGLAGSTEILIFIIGLLLLIAEVFFLPGTMLPGIAGTALIIASLMMAMVGHYPGIPWHPITRHIPDAIKSLSVSILGTFILGLILARFLPETTAFQKLMLLSAEHKADGFHASGEETASLVGLEGTAYSELRPSGTAVFGDKRIDVVTRGEYIEKNSRIIVAEAHGNRIVVELKT